MASEGDTRSETIVVPVVEEHVHVDTRPVETDRVVVRKTVETRDELVERSLHAEELSIERVPIGRVVSEAPATREEDGVLIVPVLEEELVVSTRLILKEELRIRRRESVQPVRQTIRLRREVAQVEHRSPKHDENQQGDGDNGGNG